ncbi:MAG TPA: molybdopterin cofactor-binding domain-containing protein [Candidatus Sulfotelmatobacter sp.]|jgi:isoquinoline 1-oxidoreductase beta subunit|nr:molybdopterin cofactor-binding domain-containing protein [Candidatus Sulfotelmatobacter sp.]
MVHIVVEDVTRRGFLKGMLGAGAFVLSLRMMSGNTLAASLTEEMASGGLKGPLSPNVWLAIDTDGSVYIIAHRSEMGSGSRTAVPRIAADELDADWNRVKIVQAIGDEKYGDQDTDGSHSVRGSFDAMREAGATARLMLVRAAAKQWGVPESECSTDLHVVVHKASGKKLGYGELATAASKQNVPKKEDLKLKARTEWRYIGKGTSSYDLKDMVTGKAGYGIDGWMEGMLYANVAHPPVLGSTVKSVDDKEALAVKGVRQTAMIEPWKAPITFQALGGVAVVADSTWAAIEGKKKLKIEWNESEHKNYSSDTYRKELEATSRKPAKVVREVGNVDAAFAKGGKILEAEYYAPMLAHASMEPPAALAHYKDGKVELWAATQNPQGTRDAVKDALGLKKEDVTVNVTLLGGGFGRKSFPDYAVEAAVLSKQTGKPVKVVWSREDDIKFDSFHSCAAMYLKAALDADGKPVAWLQRSTFPPIASTFDAKGVYADAGEIGLGWSDLPYAIPNHRAENGAAAAHVRIGWLRSVCNVFHAFAEHSFADELAHTAGKDSREYMLALLGPDRVIPKEQLAKDYPNYDGDYAQYPIDTARFRRVVEIATEKAGWGKKKNGNGFGMGLAMHRSFLTYVATVVQVQMDKDGKVQIQRVDTAVDAGTIVNPEMARQQYEGAAAFSTSLAFYGEITAQNGVIQQSNFDGYPMARMNVAPRETRVYLVESDAPPAGIGEPGVPPFTPALCNAIFAATGKRYRELPLSKSGLV